MEEKKTYVLHAIITYGMLPLSVILNLLGIIILIRNSSTLPFSSVMEIIGSAFTIALALNCFFFNRKLWSYYVYFGWVLVRNIITAIQTLFSTPTAFYIIATVGAVIIGILILFYYKRYGTFIFKERDRVEE